MHEPLHMALEVVITEWPLYDPPRVVTRPWVKPFRAGRYQRDRHDFPLLHLPCDYLAVDLADLVPADPGWLAGSITLIAANGRPIHTERPVRFYGRKSDTPTHIYFPSNGYDPAYSVALRVVSGGLTHE